MRPNLKLCFCCILAIAFSLPAFSLDKSTSERSTEVTFGMVLYGNAKIQMEALEPLAQYLSEKSGLDIKVKLFNDYTSILNDIDHESLDMALLSPIVYALCLEDADLTFLATELEGGKPFYHAVILARKDSSILSLKDLVGKKIGFVDRYSASGYVYPATMLKKAGLVKDEKALYTPMFLGSHDKVLRALMEGKIDAAASFENYFNYAKNQIGDTKNVTLGDFRVLKLLSEQIPNDAVVCRSIIGPKTIERLRLALKNFEDAKRSPKTSLEKTLYSGFKLDNKSAYVSVKKFIREEIGVNY